MEKSKALKNKLQAAINFQKEKAEEIETYYDFLKGKQYSNKPKKDEVTLNICHSTIQSIKNSVLRGKSYIYVEPDSKEAITSSDLAEKVINYYWRTLNVDYQLDLMLDDFLSTGLGVSYVDWDFRTDDEGKIIRDEPFVLHVPFVDFFIDPNATVEELTEAKYMVRRFYKSTKELKADSRYKHTKNIKGDKIIKIKTGEDTSSDELSFTTLYQIWIPDDECSYVMREGSDDILREVENKLGREYPFVISLNYTMPGELYPFGEIKVLYEQQKLLNRIFSLIVTHARRVATRQYVYNDLIKKEEVAKLRDAEDGEIIKVEGNAKSSDAITPIMDAPLSGDVYNAFKIINDAIVQLSNISDYRKGVMPTQQRKATEAMYIEQATEISTNAKAEKVQKHCEEIARKLFMLIKSPENIASREIVYKDEKTGSWINAVYNSKSFEGKYLFKYEAGVAAPINQYTRQQKATNILTAIANIVRINPNIVPVVNWKELLRNVLTDFDMKNVDQILTPEQEAIANQQQVMPQQMQEQGQQQISPEIMNAILASLGQNQAPEQNPNPEEGGETNAFFQ